MPSRHWTIVPLPSSKLGMQLCVEQKSELDDPLSVVVVDDVSVEVDVEQLEETDSATW